MDFQNQTFIYEDTNTQLLKQTNHMICTAYARVKTMTQLKTKCIITNFKPSSHHVSSYYFYIHLEHLLANISLLTA
jgi:predicted AlkP superfamily pyrophosphatase or phosphodiesterase